MAVSLLAWWQEQFIWKLHFRYLLIPSLCVLDGLLLEEVNQLSSTLTMEQILLERTVSYASVSMIGTKIWLEGCWVKKEFSGCSTLQPHLIWEESSPYWRSIVNRLCWTGMACEQLSPDRSKLRYGWSWSPNPESVHHWKRNSQLTTRCLCRQGDVKSQPLVSSTSSCDPHLELVATRVPTWSGYL